MHILFYIHKEYLTREAEFSSLELLSLFFVITVISSSSILVTYTFRTPGILVTRTFVFSEILLLQLIILFIYMIYFTDRVKAIRPCLLLNQHNEKQFLKIKYVKEPCVKCFMFEKLYPMPLRYIRM